MKINSETMVSITDANKNSCEAARSADKRGVIEFSRAEALQAAASVEVLESSNRLMKRNKEVYEELAK